MLARIATTSRLTKRVMRGGRGPYLLALQLGECAVDLGDALDRLAPHRMDDALGRDIILRRRPLRAIGLLHELRNHSPTLVVILQLPTVADLAAQRLQAVLLHRAGLLGGVLRQVLPAKARDASPHRHLDRRLGRRLDSCLDLSDGFDSGLLNADDHKADLLLELLRRVGVGVGEARHHRIARGGVLLQLPADLAVHALHLGRGGVGLERVPGDGVGGLVLLHRHLARLPDNRLLRLLLLLLGLRLLLRPSPFLLLPTPPQKEFRGADGPHRARSFAEFLGL